MPIIPTSAHLKNRSVLRLRGKDAFSFLQGLVSQDMTLAAEGRPLFTAFLTPQGKYLFDFFIVPTPEGLLIDCQKDQAGELVKRLGFFKMRAEVDLQDTRDLFSVLVFWGGKDMPAEVQHVGFADPRLPQLGRRAIVLTERLKLLSLGASEEDYRDHRYSLGVAEGSHEIDVGNATLFDINFDKLNAISWNKGCFMGQELCARIYHRGLVKKRYFPFRIEGITPEKNAIIRSQMFEIGQVRAAGTEYGLGMFPLEKAQQYIEKKQLLVDAGTTYELFMPPYFDSSIFAK